MLLHSRDLELLYRCEGNVVDGSGNGLDGSWQGTPGYTTGKFGQCLNLTGANCVDSNSKLPNADGLFADTGRAWTLGAWIWAPSSGIAPGATALARAGATSGDRTLQVFFAHGGTSTPGVYCRGSGTNTNLGLDDNTWHHYAFAWDGSTLRLYVDASYSMDLSVGAASEETGETFIVGARTTGSYAYKFTGLVDEVCVFGRALSLTDIRRVMMGMAPVG